MLSLLSEVYNSAKELFLNTQRFANSQGYILIKKRTQKDNYGELKNMLLQYDYSSVYHSFLELNKESNYYNQGYSNNIAGYPNVHQFIKQQIETVATMTTTSSRPREIISTLRHNNSEMLITNVNIYNACA
ncbi:8699_t:CDS:2 [Scutellospora calospora]|uniref:8699_t:CDS:1 n=1 Tax=Scutellospora calospora TaxID=85575 RepID=A0ACA9K488_9GLOM|nr:8699_t:CDS:2 [Scutellospora calospora]